MSGNRRTIIVAVVLAATLLAVPTGGALSLPAIWGVARAATGTADKASQLQKVKGRISQTREQLNAKRKQEQTALQALQRTEQDLESSQTKLGRVNHDLRVTTSRVGELQQNLSVAQTNLSEAQKDLAGHYERFSRRVRAMYEIGPINYLEIVFSATDFSDLIVRLELMERLIASDVQLFNQVKAYQARVQDEKDRIARAKTELEQRRTQIVQLKQDTVTQTRYIQSKMQARATMLAKIQNDRKAYEAELREEEATSRQLEAFIRGQQKGSSRSQISGSHLLWPVRGPITDGFGWRVHPIFHTRRFHTGLDISVPYGTSVAATGSGKVLIAGWEGGYGKAVIIDHGGGISTLYGHNSTLLVHVGQQVNAGQIIAKAGATGFATGPHVHFEVRRNGEPVNPMGWLN